MTLMGAAEKRLFPRRHDPRDLGMRTAYHMHPLNTVGQQKVAHLCLAGY